MKIISGEYKYRNIEIPRGIRPTTEKVREAVFSMIMGYVPNAVVFDAFAGSGAMGLEALSRGGAKCYFNEASRENFRSLKSNIAHCKAEEKSVLMNFDYLRAISRIEEKIDVVILDPPYDQVDYYGKAIDLLQERGLLHEGSVIVAEHLFKDKLSESYGRFKKTKEKRYGTIGVDLFEFDEILIK